MNLAESSILFATTARIRDGKRQGMTISLKLMVDYLVPRTKWLVVLDQPIRSDPDTASVHSLYIDGELNYTSRYKWAPKGKARIMLSDMIAAWDSGRYSGYRFDLFIAGDVLNAFVGYWLRKNGRVKRLCYVVADYTKDRRGRVYNILDRFAYKRADIILNTTGKDREDRGLKPKAGAFETDMPSLCPPVEPENFKPRNGHVVGYLGSLEERFGVEKTILAMPYILKEAPDATLEILGSGPDRDKLEKLAHGLPVRFWGFLPDEEAVTVATHWRVGLAPYDDTLKDVDSGKLRFYAFCGVPMVISTKTPLMVDLVNKFGAGIPADPEPEYIANVVMALLSDELLYEGCLEGCRELVEAHESTAYFDKLFSEI